ncbi:MAG: hypothetical protein GJV46_16255 [Geobacter sp.]|nr:hypothetical protein [Geobacter sp.]
MKRYMITISTVIAVGLIAGCGGSGSTPATSTAVSGKVADGYLVGATVFLDKNSNYQLDSGELSTMTDANGAYTLNMAAADVGKYPIVAMAIQGVTIDKDFPAAAMTSGYMLSMPATAVSGAVNSNFISPMSTIIREKMAANSGMTFNDSKVQLRNQMGLPVGIDMMADYIAGSMSGTNATQYQAMHTTAQQMAGLMAGQAGLVMNGSSVNLNRYRSMMATINSNMSGIASNVINGQSMTSAFMNNMMSQMQTQLGSMSISSGFVNYSGMFRNMTSSRYFWSTTAGTTTPTTPMTGGMMM